MITVQLDVPAARDAAVRLDALSTVAQDRAAALQLLAARAHEELPSLRRVPVWADGFRARAGDLHARVDLAVAVSGGDEHALTAPVRYEVRVDDGQATRERLGAALAGLAAAVGTGTDPLTPVRRLHERLDRWADDPVVAAALLDALGGPGLVRLLAACGELGAASPAAAEPATRLARLVRRAARTAANGWAEQGAERGRALAVTGTPAERAAVSFLAAGRLPAEVLVGLADALEEQERAGAAPAPAALPGGSWLGLEGEERGAALDPAAGVLHALADHPEAALAWLTAGGPPRRAHWLARAWADGGARLGDLLGQATTAWQVLDDPDLDPAAQEARAHAAATVVADLLARLDPAAAPAAGPALAQVLAAWLHGLDASVNAPVPEPSGRVARGLRDAAGAPLPPAPLAEPARVVVVAGLALAGDEGLARLRAALTAHSAAALRAAASAGSGRLADAVLAQSALSALLASAVEGGRREAWVDLGARPVRAEDWQALLPALSAYAGRPGVDDAVLGQRLWAQWLGAVGDLGAALGDDVRDGCTAVFTWSAPQTGWSPT